MANDQRDSYRREILNRISNLDKSPVALQSLAHKISDNPDGDVSFEGENFHVKEVLPHLQNAWKLWLGGLNTSSKFCIDQTKLALRVYEDTKELTDKIVACFESFSQLTSSDKSDVSGLSDITQGNSLDPLKRENLVKIFQEEERIRLKQGKYPRTDDLKIQIAQVEKLNAQAERIVKLFPHDQQTPENRAVVFEYLRIYAYQLRNKGEVNEVITFLALQSDPKIKPLLNTKVIAAIKDNIPTGDKFYTKGNFELLNTLQGYDSAVFRPQFDTVYGILEETLREKYIRNPKIAEQQAYLIITEVENGSNWVSAANKYGEGNIWEDIRQKVKRDSQDMDFGKFTNADAKKNAKLQVRKDADDRIDIFRRFEREGRKIYIAGGGELVLDGAILETVNQINLTLIAQGQDPIDPKELAMILMAGENAQIALPENISRIKIDKSLDTGLHISGAITSKAEKQAKGKETHHLPTVAETEARLQEELKKSQPNLQAPLENDPNYKTALRMMGFNNPNDFRIAYILESSVQREKLAQLMRDLAYMEKFEAQKRQESLNVISSDQAQNTIQLGNNTQLTQTQWAILVKKLNVGETEALCQTLNIPLGTNLAAYDITKLNTSQIGILNNFSLEDGSLFPQQIAFIKAKQAEHIQQLRHPATTSEKNDFGFQPNVKKIQQEILQKQKLVENEYGSLLNSEQKLTDLLKNPKLKKLKENVKQAQTFFDKNGIAQQLRKGEIGFSPESVYRSGKNRFNEAKFLLKKLEKEGLTGGLRLVSTQPSTFLSATVTKGLTWMVTKGTVWATTKTGIKKAVGSGMVWAATKIGTALGANLLFPPLVGQVISIALFAKAGMDALGLPPEITYGTAGGVLLGGAGFLIGGPIGAVVGGILGAVGGATIGFVMRHKKAVAAGVAALGLGLPLALGGLGKLATMALVTLGNVLSGVFGGGIIGGTLGLVFPELGAPMGVLLGAGIGGVAGYMGVTGAGTMGFLGATFQGSGLVISGGFRTFLTALGASLLEKSSITAALSLTIGLTFIVVILTSQQITTAFSLPPFEGKTGKDMNTPQALQGRGSDDENPAQTKNGAPPSQLPATQTSPVPGQPSRPPSVSGQPAQPVACGDVKIDYPKGIPAHGTITQGTNGGYSHGGDNAIDIAGQEGDIIRASHNGTIISTGYDANGYGNYIVIQDKSGYKTLYGHLSSITVSSGSVTAGQAIGNMGSTGNSTGPHLHYELFGLDNVPLGCGLGLTEEVLKKVNSGCVGASECNASI